MEDSYDDQYLEAGGHFEDYNLDPTDGASGIVAVRLCSVPGIRNFPSRSPCPILVLRSLSQELLISMQTTM
jgi:hypothetical protein